MAVAVRGHEDVERAVAGLVAAARGNGIDRDGGRLRRAAIEAGDGHLDRVGVRRARGVRVRIGLEGHFPGGNGQRRIGRTVAQLIVTKLVKFDPGSVNEPVKVTESPA